MEVAKLIIDLIGKIIWPTVVITIVLLFRKSIILLIPYIKNIKAGGVEFTIEKIEKIVEETVENKISSNSNKNEKFNQLVYQEEESDAFENNNNNNIGADTMLAVTTNKSFNENVEYGIYYDPVERNHNYPFKYLGLYKDGEIKAIGRVLKIAYCNYDKGNLVSSRNEESLNNLSYSEYDRIKGIIENTHYYDLEKGCKFFIVDKFYPTEFIKTTNYPLRGKKYISLNDIEGFKEGMSTSKLAEFLNYKEW